MRRASSWAALAAAASLAAPGVARADPQFNLALSFGAGARVAPSQAREALVGLALRADALFGARTPFAPRVGPYLTAGTHDFDDLTVGVGASVQLPVSPTYPLVLSAGAFVDALAVNPVRPGVLARLWWGTRSYNYHSRYVMVLGGWIEARHTPALDATDLVVGIDGDLGFLTLPVVLLYEALRR